MSKSDGFAYCNGSEWQGTLSVLSPGNMYKVRVTDDAKAQVLGGTIDVRNKEVTMYKGWNWIGSLSVYNLGLDEAFADLNCTDGDAIKSKTQIAFFNGQKWEGQLRAIIPGDGYYFYNSGPTRTFHYPAGNHFIEVRRSGHTFVDGGRYPAEQGSSYNFVSDTNLDFYDNTLVVFAGRITGGSNEGKKPLGYGLSQNTIGKTTLKIQSLDHPQRMINAVEQVRGTTREWVPNPQTVELSNSSERWHRGEL